MNKPNLLISFSGGETSAYMTYYILKSEQGASFRECFQDIVCVFANTGQENEETLQFVDRFSTHFGISVVWLESKVYLNQRKGTSHVRVDFGSANRDGAVFENMIRKYGIPNQAFPHCTRELKMAPIHSFIRNELRWDGYKTAIGIRADEIDRVSDVARRDYGAVYPLVENHPVRKTDINAWWSKQPFRLNLKGYQGNCKWCWKKSDRKLFTIVKENRVAFDFPAEMESRYAYVGPEFLKHQDTLPTGYKRTFFRKGRSALEIIDEATRLDNSFLPAEDDSIKMPHFDERLDVGGGCEESCEVFSESDMAKYSKKYLSSEE